MDDIVWVLPSCCGAAIGDDVEVMVAVRPGGGAEPKMLEKAASRWLLEDGPYRR